MMSTTHEAEKVGATGKRPELEGDKHNEHSPHSLYFLAADLRNLPCSH